MTPTYRPDIDGLRAVAVLSILFFHLDIEAFGGGYVGVDIFFVISGYLITSIIVRELAAGEFSIARFYERRVRRILPALTVVLATTLLVGSVLLDPGQFAELGRSAAATSVFSSNVFFYMGSGYFDGPSELKPLLHTWSLAVEEQYYILFPFLLVLIAKRFAARFAPWLAAICAASLVGCVVWTGVDETAAFYLLPFRAWELLIGSLLALGAVPRVRGALLRNVLSTSGLVMLLTAVFAYTPETRFPGVAALLPTLGTAMVIHAGAGGDAWVNRALGLKALVFVGLISYSLYLWHWPVVVYARHFLINEPNAAEAGVMLAASLLLAALSWRYVETPFRNRNFAGPRARLFLRSGVAVGAVLAASLTVALTNGFPQRAAGSPLAAVIAGDPGWQHWKACEELGERDDERPELCRLGAAGASPSFLFWGDSHALALASAVNLSASGAGVAGRLAVRTGCPPLLSIERPGRESCQAFNDAILGIAARHPEIDTVILAARWAISTNGTRYKNESGRSVTLIDLLDDDAPNDVLFARGLRRTVDALAGLNKRIVLVTQVPEIGYDVPAANYMAKLTGRDVNVMVAPTTREYRMRTASARSALTELALDYPLTIVDPSGLLCESGRCRVAVDGVPLYRDDNHLSLRGCVLVSGLFDGVFAER